MDLIKKIIVSILTIVGIALAGVIICLGVLVVFPNTKIFGISYINTNNKEPEQIVVKDINFGALENDYTLKILSNNYDVEIVETKENTDYIDIYFTNNIVGFTKELDSNKKAQLNTNYDSSSKTVTLEVKEPDGVFLKRNTVVKISIPTKLLNKNVNVVSVSNKGTTTFGTKDNALKVNNLELTCLNAKGGVNLDNAIINGDLKISNILGRINVKNEIKGIVSIDSTVGTYTFDKVNNIEVLKSSVEGRTNNPAITLNECNNIKWTAESGNLIVKNYVLGKIEVDTQNANFDIEKALDEIRFVGTSSNVKINQIGNFEEDSTSSHNSFDWRRFDFNTTEGAANLVKYNAVRGIQTTSGDIIINRAYFKLNLKTEKGKIDVKNATREVMAETTTGSIKVDFHYGDDIATTNNDYNSFMNQYLIKYLDGDLSDSTSLKITTVDGPITVSNIRNSVDIVAERSSVDLTYKTVKNASNIKTSSKAVNVKAPISNFLLTTKMAKKSSASLKVAFGSLVMNSYDDKLPDTERVSRADEGEYKCLYVRVSNADKDQADRITIINTTGKINASSI